MAEYSYKFKNIPTDYNFKSKYTLICPNGHEWDSSMSNFRNGRRCPKCKDLKNFETVKNIIESKGYKMISDSWNGSKGKLKILCDHGHRIEMNPDRIKSGSICKVCSDKIK